MDSSGRLARPCPSRSRRIVTIPAHSPPRPRPWACTSPAARGSPMKGALDKQLAVCRRFVGGRRHVQDRPECGPVILVVSKSSVGSLAMDTPGREGRLRIRGSGRAWRGGRGSGQSKGERAVALRRDRAVTDYYCAGIVISGSFSGLPLSASVKMNMTTVSARLVCRSLFSTQNQWSRYRTAAKA